MIRNVHHRLCIIAKLRQPTILSENLHRSLIEQRHQAVELAPMRHSQHDRVDFVFSCRLEKCSKEGDGGLGTFAAVSFDRRKFRIHKSVEFLELQKLRRQLPLLIVGNESFLLEHILEVLGEPFAFPLRLDVTELGADILTINFSQFLLQVTDGPHLRVAKRHQTLEPGQLLTIR